MLLVIIGAGLAGLAALPRRGGVVSAEASGGGGSQGPPVVSTDSYFYGQSPPVYPSRKPCTFGPWHGTAEVLTALFPSRYDWRWRLGYRVQQGP
jgi:hypothetical protein